MIKFIKKLRKKINKNLPTLGEKFDSQNRKHQIFVIAIAGYVFFILSVLYFNSISVSSFASDTNVNVEKPETVKFVSDEVLIKVRKSSVSRIREDSINVGIDSLNSLNKEFKVKKMKKAVRESQKSRADSEIFQWYIVKFDEPREELNSTQSEVNTQLNDLISDDIATSIVDKSRKKTTGNASKDKFFSRLAKYAKDVNIERVEPNYLVTIDQVSTPSATPTSAVSVSPTPTTASLITPTVIPPLANIPNDPYYSSSGSWGQTYPDLWGIKKINSEGAWNTSKGTSNIIVAVIDTGIDRNHEDLQGNMWINTKEIPNNGVDDDGNGYIDDYYGCNFINMTNKICGDPMDDHGHGTHVAGTIGAVGNNGKGVVGVNWSSSIMALKFLSGSGSGYASDGATAIIYAADNGARVISNSWGGPSFSQVIHDAVEYAHSKNVITVAAAGNSNSDVGSFSPASEEKVITVAATDSNDQKASFSNYGAKIDVAAPGVDTLSLKASTSPMCGASNTVGNNYCRVSGTSMATPHVSGLAALILSKHPEFTNEDVRQVLRASADDIGTPGFDIYTGRGRINAQKALSVNSVLKVNIQTPIGSGNGQIVDIKGTAAGPDFVNYQLSYSSGLTLTNWIPIGNFSSPVNNGLLAYWNTQNLSAGLYTLRLIATNSGGYNFDTYSLSYKENWVSPLGGVQTNQQWRPSISGNKVVFSDSRNGNVDIYMYDLSTKQERKITNNPSGQARISGNKIVYEDHRRDPYGTDIYLFDLDTNTERPIAVGPSMKGNPDIWGDKIVWEDDRDFQYRPNIYLYDLKTQTTRRLAPYTSNQKYPRINGDKVVWQQRYGYHYDIYLFDLTTNTLKPISTYIGPGPEVWRREVEKIYPSIWGDKVVWEDSRNKRSSLDFDEDIYLYDLTTNVEKRVTTNPHDQMRPTIFGNKIVYEDDRNGGQGTYNSDIYMYDLDTNTETAIATNPERQETPATDGNRIVWNDFRNAPFPGSNIYKYEFPNSSLDTDGDGFSDSIEQYMGTNPNLKCGINAWPPDFNNDGKVMTADTLAVIQKYGTTNHRYDLTMDGKVTSADTLMENSYYGKKCQ